ncbi:unnamed protein product [Ilex paraguariensis]|uniref:Uncharacterized protein n=1 Tax=Ilex paraguariensis TaxID=185542 RepID=A0ABC8TSF0_9AQUA
MGSHFISKSRPNQTHPLHATPPATTLYSRPNPVTSSQTQSLPLPWLMAQHYPETLHCYPHPSHSSVMAQRQHAAAINTTAHNSGSPSSAQVPPSPPLFRCDSSAMAHEHKSQAVLIDEIGQNVLAQTNYLPVTAVSLEPIIRTFDV